jgi:aryl-alcohol dehydrogenase-like predicted oxidoreductase
MEQPQYNMLHRDRFEREYHRLYDGLGLGTTIWSPLASGVLTNKYADGIPDGSRMALPDYAWLRAQLESAEGRKKIETAAALKPIADDLGCSMAQLAIAWCLKNPNVSTVILGASRVEQLEENLESAGIVESLNDDVMQRIEGVLGNKPELPTQW